MKIILILILIFFINTQTITKELKNKKEIKNFVRFNGNNTILYEWKTKKQKKQFMSNLKDHLIFDYFPIGLYHNKSINEPRITVYRNNSKMEYKKNFKIEEFISWLEYKGHPLIEEFTSENFHSYLDLKSLTVTFFLNFTKTKQTKKYQEVLKKTARFFKTKIRAGYVNQDNHNEHTDDLGFNTKMKVPVITAMNLTRNFNYVYNYSKLDYEKLKEWIQSVLDDKEYPYFRSEEIPKKNNKDIKVVVGNTFIDLVERDNKNDFLLYYYANWCRFCQGKFHEIKNSF
jgi:hypothetical protein